MMNMRLGSIFFAGSLIFLASCSSSKKTVSEPDVKLQNTTLPVVVDGKADEWKSVSLQLSPKNSFEYTVANTPEELCIFIKIPDQVEQTKLLRGGMEVYINPKGKKDKETAVFYPVKGELPEDMRAQAAPGEKEDVKEIRLRIAGQLISMNRTGFKTAFNGVQSIRQNTGFKAAINWDENDNLIYELAIPYAAFPDGLNKNNLELGFFINGAERPKNNNSSGSNTTWSGGNQGMGGGRMGGGRMGGGRQGGRSFSDKRDPGLRSSTNKYNQWQKLYVDENFWVQYGG